MHPDPPRNTSHLRRSAHAFVYQASHYRGAYWLIAHCPPQKNSTQHATAGGGEFTTFVQKKYKSRGYCPGGGVVTAGIDHA
jgi:hypothetical protein